MVKNLSAAPWSGRVLRAAEQLSLCAVATGPALWSPQATAAEAHEPGARASQQGKPPQWAAHRSKE